MSYMSYIIRPGSVVVLRSGGPRMTVNKMVCFGVFAVCRWFDEHDQLHMKTFRTRSIRKLY